MRRIITIFFCFVVFGELRASIPVNPSLPEQNLERAIALADAAFENHYRNSRIYDNYNPYTGIRVSNSVTSIWGHTSLMACT